jgi:rhodanese-related sulfurtransferase
LALEHTLLNVKIAGFYHTAISHGEITNMNFRNLFLFLTISLLSACSEPPYTNIDNQQLKALQAQGIPVFDIRRTDEWKQTGVVEGSKRLTFVDDKGRVNPEFVEKFTQAVGKNDPVILICRTGNRTDVLGRALVEQLGYTKVYNVKNGITRWISEGLPLVRN